MQNAEPTENIKMATIIGGQGFVGCALTAHLKNAGYNLWVPSKNDPQVFEKELGHVFYCAGLTADYLQRPFDTVNAHVNVLSDVLHRANWEHLVYLSSTRVYDGLSGVVDEACDLMLNPNNARHFYDLSKLMGESLCLQTGRASVARLACVYCDESDENGFLPALLRQALRSESRKLMVDSSPYYSRDYVYLEDVVNALVTISREGKSEIYNVASGQNVCNNDIFSVIEKICGLSIVATRNDEPTLSPHISIEKMQTNFGWNAKKVLPTIECLLKEKVNKHAKNN